MSGTGPAATSAEGTTGRTVLRGGAWNGAALLLPQVYTLFFSVVVARLLGPTDLGRQSFIAFISLSAVTLFTAGLPRSVMRFTGVEAGAGRTSKVRYLSDLSWRVTWLCALVGLAAVGGTALVVSELKVSWLLAGIVVALSVLQTSPSSILLGLQRWRGLSTISLVTGPLGLAAGVVVLLNGGGITGIFAVEVGVSAVSLTWAWLLARRVLAEVAPSAEPDPVLRREVLRYAGASSFGVIIGLIVWRRSELLVLEQTAAPDQIAMFSIAFAAATALGRIPEAVVAALSPALAAVHGGGDPHRLSRGFGRAVRLTLSGSTVLAGMGLALGPVAVEVVYGAEYALAGTVLMVMMVFFPFGAVAAVGNAGLVALGVWRLPLAATACAAVVDIVAAFTLIPRYGAIGAAVANGLATGVASVPLLVHSARRFGPLDWYPWVQGRMLLVTVLAAGSGALVADRVPGLIGLAAGTTAAGLLLLALGAGMRAIAPEDAGWLDGLTGGRLPGPVGRVLTRLART